MRAHVRFRLHDGREIDLGNGDIIGRLVGAALHIDDPRVSEAHALLSIRRGEFVLLSLRKMVTVRGKPVAELVLRAGLQIVLAEGVTLTVLSVERPHEVFAMEADGLGRRVLPGLSSLSLDGLPRLAPHFEEGADLHVWWNGDGFRVRAQNGPTLDVFAGLEMTVRGTQVRFVMMQVDSSTTTPGGGAGHEPPLRIVAWYDGVEIHRDGHPPVVFGGVGARILSELATVQGPLEWELVAREVWHDAADANELRHRWDVNLARLRSRLREAGVRRDLLRSNGAGYVQLVRYGADIFEDKT